jgi:tripartite-type tricarboxylate transporter receptor subunit TctC
MTLNSIRRTVALTASLMLLPNAWVPVQAQTYPSKPITFIVPFPAGSATDLMARILAEHIGKSAGQAIVVDNKAGANGTIGTAAAAKAAPDGYNFVIATSTTHAANASLYRKLPYDPIKDFTPVSQLSDIPFVMLVHPSVPADTAQKFVAHAKANPDKLAWGHGSSGSLIPGNALVTHNKLNMVAVPYKGVQPAVADALGNQVQMVFADIANALPQVKAGKLKALAVTSAAEHPLLPGVAPLSAVVPGFEMNSWFAMYAPTGTPSPIVNKMNEWVRAALKDSAVQTKLNTSGFRLTPSSPAELGVFTAKETIKWAKAVTAAGIIPE